MGDFVWTERSLRWMCDAAQSSGYYEAIAGRLKPYLKSGARVLELGCGTGALAKALAPHVGSVTALDSSALAISALTDAPDNVLPVVMDAFSFEPSEPFDALVLCYFSRPDEFLRFSRLCSGTALLLCEERRSEDYERRLQGCGIRYEKENFSLSHDQLLRSLEEARAYAAYYGRPIAIAVDDLVFPYLDRITRDIALLRYACGGER